jgi:hypothetical protein
MEVLTRHKVVTSSSNPVNTTMLMVEMDMKRWTDEMNDFEIFKGFRHL